MQLNLEKVFSMRRLVFFGVVMLSMKELEYTGIVKRLETLDERFEVRD